MRTLLLPKDQLGQEEIPRHVRFSCDSRNRETSERKFSEGKSLLPLNPNLDFYLDVSDLGWGALLGSKEVSGTWSPGQKNWHISVNT